jgi:hypothetical protein
MHVCMYVEYIATWSSETSETGSVGNYDTPGLNFSKQPPDMRVWILVFILVLVWSNAQLPVRFRLTHEIGRFRRNIMSR